MIQTFRDKIDYYSKYLQGNKTTGDPGPFLALHMDS
jgi:hypothetical protein